MSRSSLGYKPIGKELNLRSAPPRLIIVGALLLSGMAPSSPSSVFMDPSRIATDGPETLSPATTLDRPSAALSSLGVGVSSSLGVSTTPDWFFGLFGASVASAGDVNGDGYSDVIVGGMSRALVFLGSQEGLSTAPAWGDHGIEDYDRYGSSVAGAGDVDRDGYSDVLVGEPGIDDGRGRVSLYFGSSKGLTTDSAVHLTGDPSSGFGTVVAGAGDVNGDGFADFLISAPTHTVTVSAAGRVYVYLGGPRGTTLAAWTVDGAQPAADFGSSVASAGDVDGDGFDDIIVGAPQFAVQGSAVGSAQVLRGSPAGMLPTPPLIGSKAGARHGWSVSSAGDVNGDGYSDIIVGADRLGIACNLGAVWVYLGSSSGIAGQTPWTRSDSHCADRRLGASTASAIDANGDGYSDIIVGAPWADGHWSAQGRAYLFLGSSSGLSTQPDWQTEGDRPNEMFGGAVASAGDVNGDGYSDLLVAATGYTEIIPDVGNGAVFLFLGGASGPAHTPSTHLEIDTVVAAFGSSVSSAGDVNGDGHADLVVGAPRFGDGFNSPGRAYVYLGSPAGMATDPSWMVQGEDGSDHLGSSVAGAGDVNGDGYDDIIVSATLRDYGKVYLYLGSSSGPGSSPQILGGTQYEGRFGQSVASAGDIDGDGFGDIVVSEPDAYHISGYGWAHVFYGSPHGLDVDRRLVFSDALDQENFGESVASAGDVNGDGYSDVIVGAERFFSNATAGRALVYLGSSVGLTLPAAWQVKDPELFGAFGASVATAGDVNGDGFSDVVVGSPLYGVNNTSEGAAFLYLGSSAGPSLAPAWSATGDQYASLFGQSVASAGDINNDGFSDVLVGARRHDEDPSSAVYPGFDNGRAFVFLGSLKGLSSNPAWSTDGNGRDASLGTSVTSVGDINGDGYSDIAIGSPGLTNPEVGEGGADVFLGNRGGKLKQLATQRRLGSDAPIPVHGRSDLPDAIPFELEFTPRAKVQRAYLEWESRGPGQPFSSEDLGRGQPVAFSRNPEGVASLEGLIDQLAPGFYHWRARLVFADALQPRTPWLSVTGNSPTQTKIIVGSPAPPRLGSLGPGPLSLVYPDSEPLAFSWHCGGETSHFTLYWSSNPDFTDRLEVADVTGPINGIGIHQPDPASWLRILGLGRYPDARSSPVFWTAQPRGASPPPPSTPGSGISWFMLAPPQAPSFVAPTDDAAFLDAGAPPILLWKRNHNSGFELRVSASSSLSNPRVVLGSAFSLPFQGILSGAQGRYVLTPQDWASIVALARSTPDRKIYYAVFGRDSVGRVSWSTVRALRVVESGLRKPMKEARRHKRDNRSVR